MILTWSDPMDFTQLLRKITTGSAEQSRPPSVGITPTLKSIVVTHKGERITIKRDKNTEAVIPSLFSRVSRPCPPFCVQPMKIAEGVETIGELELIDYLQKIKEGSTIVVDSRLKNWERKGTIPGSIHIPWTRLATEEGATIDAIVNVLIKQFSVNYKQGKSVEDIEEALKKGNLHDILAFSNAKMVVLFCNGTWCGQTSKSIKSLLELGFPQSKLKYYRDGMQGWVSLGLTTVSDEEVCTLVK